MSAKSSSTVAQKAPNKSAPKRRSLLRHTFGWFCRPLPLTIIAITTAGVRYWPEIVRHVPELSSRDEYRLAWSDITVTPPGRWVPQNLREQVRQQSGLPDPLRLLDETVVERVAIAFARHPWVSDVESVEKRAGGIDVRLTYRRPTIMVQTPRGMYPVDAEGVLLPPADFSSSDAVLFPRVEDVRSSPQGQAGTFWGDVAVVGAARLADRLTSMTDREESSAWERFDLEAVVVLIQSASALESADTLDGIVYGLTTTTGSRIVWGHAPGGDSLEPTVDQKIRRLDNFFAEPRLEPVMVDIRGWEAIHWDVLSRMTEERGAASGVR